MNADETKPAVSAPPRRRFLVWIVVVGLAAGAYGGYWHFAHRPQAFIRQWSERFRSLDSLDAARQLAQTEPCVVLRVLPSHEWFVTTCEHSCCSGAGFDATVIRDSSGAIYADTAHTFCGIEGLAGELGERAVPATTLPAFYSAISRLKLQRQ